MKRQTSVREFVNLSKLLFKQENVIRCLFDEVEVLAQSMQIDNEDLALISVDFSVNKQVRICRALVYSFPLKHVSMHLYGCVSHWDMMAKFCRVGKAIDELKTMDFENAPQNLSMGVVDGMLCNLSECLELVESIKEYHNIK